MTDDISWVVNLRYTQITPVFEFFTWLGYRDFLFLFIPFIYWCFDRKTFGRLVLLVFFAALINTWLKDFFQDPRPDPSLSIDPWLHDNQSYGFPSGHSQLAVIIWLYIVLNVENKLVRIFSLISLVCVPLSRLYLGVHDLSDIFGGLSIGLIILFTAQFIFQKIDSGYYIKNTTQFIIISFTLILFYITWPLTSTISVVISFSGFIIGFWFGHQLDNRNFKFSRIQNTYLHYLSSVIALLGFLMINNLINGMVDRYELSSQFTDFITSTLLGFYISFFALYVLSKIKLQSRMKV